MLSCQSHLSFPHAGCHGNTSYINQSCWGVRWLLSAINNILSPSKAMTRKTNYSSIRYRFLRRLCVGPVIVTGHVLHRPSLLQPLIWVFFSSSAYYKAILCSMQLCDCQKKEAHSSNNFHTVRVVCSACPADDVPGKIRAAGSSSPEIYRWDHCCIRGHYPSCPLRYFYPVAVYLIVLILLQFPYAWMNYCVIMCSAVSLSEYSITKKKKERERKKESQWRANMFEMKV